VIDARLREERFLYDVLGYVYFWQMDDVLLSHTKEERETQIWIRELHPRLDADDKSRFAEVWVPLLKVQVELKQSNYLVPELGKRISTPHYRIVRAAVLPHRTDDLGSLIGLPSLTECTTCSTRATATSRPEIRSASASSGLCATWPRNCPRPAGRTRK
jgi:hypothetical protein